MTRAFRLIFRGQNDMIMSNTTGRCNMTKSRTDRKKQIVRIGALAVAGVMIISVLLATLLK